MPVTFTEQHGGKELDVRVSGKLTHADYQRFVPEFERLVTEHGKIRVLFELADFRGWQTGALWDDIKFDLKHFADIERLAIVGDKKWQRGMATFCRPFTTARIRFFDRTLMDASQAWLNGEFDGNDVEPPPVLPVFQTKDQTKAFYNKISQVYDLLSDRSEAPMRKAGLDLLNAKAGERVLELGFGTGHSLVMLAKAVGPKGKVFGLDLSDRMAKVAKANLAKAELLTRAQLRCGDAAQLPYADRSMDAVFMSFTLELFDTPEIPKVLRECRRVLRPNGRIVVVGMSKDGGRDPLIGVFEWTHKHFPNFLDCRPIYVRQSMAKAGFQIAKSLKKHMWVPVEIVLGVKK